MKNKIKNNIKNILSYKYFLVLFLFFARIVFFQNTTIARTGPMPTDSRIKTFIYDQNEIFQVKFMVGYQSILELQKGENVEMIIFGDATPWNVRVIGRRVFLKALEPGVKTNMTIITDKRMYMLEISSNSDYGDIDEKITFVMRFYYPKFNIDILPEEDLYDLFKISLKKEAIMNKNYTYATKGKSVKSIIPIAVFDDGKKTYFKFKKRVHGLSINAVTNDFYEIPIKIHKRDKYVYVDTVSKYFTIRKGNNVVCIFNEEKIFNKKNTIKTAYKNK